MAVFTSSLLIYQRYEFGMKTLKLEEPIAKPVKLPYLMSITRILSGDGFMVLELNCKETTYEKLVRNGRGKLNSLVSGLPA